MNCRICNSKLDHTGLCPNCGFDEGLAYEYYPTLQQLDGLSLSGRRKNWEEKIAAQNSIPARNVKCEFKNGTLRVSGTDSIGAADLQKLVAGSTSGKPALDKIKKVIIEEGIKTIEDDCFANCTSLESVVLPDGLLSIGKSAFCLCHQLTTLEIPDSCTSIGNNAFSFCRSLSSIHLPRKLTKIESHLFWGCDSLASIIVPDRVDSIGDMAFAQCRNLTAITIPLNVREITQNAFLSCDHLKDIYYSGTKEDWDCLSIHNDGLFLSVAVIHYGTSSAITDKTSVKERKTARIKTLVFVVLYYLFFFFDYQEHSSSFSMGEILCFLILPAIAVLMAFYCRVYILRLCASVIIGIATFFTFGAIWSLVFYLPDFEVNSIFSVLRAAVRIILLIGGFFGTINISLRSIGVALKVGDLIKQIIKN